MKFAGARSITRSRVPLIALMALAAIGMAGCEGDDGKDGAAGPTGGTGATGPVGPTGPTGPGLDPILSANAESCGTCHSGAGDGHQSVYDKYVDASKLDLELLDYESVADGAGTFTATLTFTVKKSGANVTGVDICPTTASSVLQKTFYATRWDGAGKFTATKSLYACPSSSSPSGTGTMTYDAGSGVYTLVTTGVAFAAEQGTGGIAYAYVAQDELDVESGGSYHLYDNLDNDALEFGNVETYVSAANAEGCQKCHGEPYLKHGYRAAVVQGVPDFVACKACHWDDRNGGHRAWQHMVDDPLAWATGPETTDAKYNYKATIMNDVHMSHAMEFPYPQSMANCVTCHEGKLDRILADAQFVPATCKSCHPVTGKDAWEDEPYYQEAGDGGRARAPALTELWTAKNLMGVHGALDVSSPTACVGCHDADGPGSRFTAYHGGREKQIYTATGERYDELYGATIDSVEKTGDVLNIAFSSNNTSAVPMVMVSLYGYDTKDFIVSAHTGDGSTRCWSSRTNSPSGCTMEYTVGTNAGEHPNPLFTETATGVAGTWEVDLDLAGYIQPAATAGVLGSLPELIASGVVKTIEVTVLPTLTIDGVSVAAKGEGKTYTVTPTSVTERIDYFKDDAKLVDNAKCNNCHDALGTTFHSPQYGSAGVVGCRNCHTTVSGGSHLEMQSRSIDSYAHAIHAFQNFDTGGADRTDGTVVGVDFTDPVAAKRYAHHVEATFPNFTLKNCEGCHVGGVYNVPDQSKSMPGLHSAAYVMDNGWYVLDANGNAQPIDDRNIGSVPSYVTGPASRACGGCHRAEAINEDNAGDLAAFNAHAKNGGYLVENATGAVYKMIDHIMSMFE